MAEHDPSHSGGKIDTGGGAFVGGGVDTRSFVGRDNITNVTINVTGAELHQLTATLFALLATPGVQLRAGEVVAAGQAVAVPPELADALRKFLDAAPGPTLAERERQYLLRLCVDPDFQQWQQRYVALAGGYRAVPELTPAYSAILVRGEGPQRQIERVALPDIRTALDKHAVLILLAQPGAGKTTVLQRLSLDRAVACLQGEPAARLPLYVRLSAQEAAESPRAFLARIWREHVPGSVDGEGELRTALRQGRLCLLVDAINEARRENIDARMADWREFAAELPAGNQLVFSCRTLDYNGELAVQQVEIDPLAPAQIEEFAVRYLGETPGQSFWLALRERHAELLELAATPYYLHMLVEVYDARGDLPANRAQLFAQFVMQLFDRERRKRHAVAWIEPAAQHLALGELAFAMQEVGEGTQVDEAWAKAKLPAQVTLPPPGRSVATPPDDVLALARAATFLAGDGQVKFAHHLLQEYFAVKAAHTPFGQAVFVHYSNLERTRRQEIEQQFAQAGAAICFASSTLELGIDIGSIDVAILIGAPGSAAAFVQRIGRAGRRQQSIQAACFYRTPLEEALLATLAATPAAAPAGTSFRPSVAVQQIFSVLLQSPTGAVRLQPLAELFDGLLTAADLEAILGQLQEKGYLVPARAGEWRADRRLNQLVDLQASDYAPLSLYSNIQNRPAKLKIRDQHSQQVVATVDALWLDREVLTLEGRQLDVSWYDGEALWVTARRDEAAPTRLPYLSTRQLLSFALAQRLGAHLGFAAGSAALVETAAGWLLFHWLGDVYGQALLDLLQPMLPVEGSAQPGLCLLLRDEPRSLPELNPRQVTRYLHEHERQYEGLLALGAYQHLLPRTLRRQAVVEQFDVACFVRAVAELRPARAGESAAAVLADLVPLRR